MDAVVAEAQSRVKNADSQGERGAKRFADEAFEIVKQSSGGEAICEKFNAGTCTTTDDWCPKGWHRCNLKNKQGEACFGVHASAKFHGKRGDAVLAANKRTRR